MSVISPGLGCDGNTQSYVMGTSAALKPLGAQVLLRPDVQAGTGMRVT